MKEIAREEQIKAIRIFTYSHVALKALGKLECLSKLIKELRRIVNESGSEDSNEPILGFPRHQESHRNEKANDGFFSNLGMSRVWVPKQLAAIELKEWELEDLAHSRRDLHKILS